VVVALLIVIGVGAYAIVHFGSNDDKAKPIAVPTVVGQLPAAAAQQLKQAGFVPKNGGTTSAKCSGGQSGVPGRVCTLEPDVGQMAKKGSTVTYFVYKTPTVQVPYLVGLSYHDAAAKLMDLNLKPKQQNVDSSQPINTVIAQSPQQLALAAPGSTVTLQVSNGKTKLPDVTGKDFDDARKSLNAAGFTDVVKGDTKTTHEQKKDNKVYDENPTGGSSYTPDTKITLSVYNYKPLPPTCTVAPTSPTSTTKSPGPPAPTTTTPGASSSSGLPACASKTG
jgi:serine/threonine-protein kinase